MDEQLNHAPCGFLTLSEDGMILSVNQTLLQLLDYSHEQLIGKHIHSIFTVSARLFYQLYFFPLIKLEKQVEEMYISLESRHGEEIPVLINALPGKNKEQTVISCVLIPMRKRSEFENELLAAKKEAEAALAAKNQANIELTKALKALESKQAELMELNKKNQQYKIETKKELELARKIQEISLTDPIVNNRIEIEAYYQATSELSGDMYGCYQIDSSRYGIILLDVMGHGVSSAMITMSLHSLFQKLILKEADAEVVMKELDSHLHTLFSNNEEARHYCTAIYLLIDLNKKEINYINAGHPPALWQDGTGNQFSLCCTSPPLGAFEGTVFKPKTFTYTGGGRLVLYTDGVIDPLESECLSVFLKENLSTSLSAFKNKMLESLITREKEFYKNDDQCFILIDIKETMF